MGLLVGNFEHNGTPYFQLIFVSEDDRVEVQDAKENIILTFTADCYIMAGTEIIGHLTQRDGRIFYRYNNDPSLEYRDTGVGALILDAYFKAEEIITKNYLDKIKEG